MTPLKRSLSGTSRKMSRIDQIAMVWECLIILYRGLIMTHSYYTVIS